MKKFFNLDSQMVKIWKQSFILLMTLLVSSCRNELPEGFFQKAESASVIIGNVKATFANERLIFSSDSDLKEAIGVFDKMNEATFYEWEAQNRFHSLYTHIKTLFKNADVEEKSPEYLVKTGKLSYVQDHALARILNKDGIIQLKDDLYKVGSKDVFHLKAKDEALLSTDLSKNSAVKRKPIIITVQSLPNAKTAGDQYQYFGNKNRIECSFWQENYLFYATAAIKTEFQEERERCFLWWCNNKWEQASCQEVGLKINNVTVYEWVWGVDEWFHLSNIQVTDNSRAFHRFSWVVNGGIEISNLNAEHWGIYNGQRRDAYTYW